ncbi:MAG: hypothetical protein IJU56_00305 [Clostridia bacterium]|nr:hypothetical protein [Clostridia bacterium]
MMPKEKYAVKPGKSGRRKGNQEGSPLAHGHLCGMAESVIVGYTHSAECCVTCFAEKLKGRRKSDGK